MCIVGRVSLPRYITNAGLARHFGVEPTAVSNWRGRYPPSGDVLPTPAPAAEEITARGPVPLWREDQLSDWDTWRSDHAEALEAWRHAPRPRLRGVTSP